MKIRYLFFLVSVFLLSGIALSNADAVRSADASVLDSYQKIQLALAADTLKDVPENAQAISKTVKADREKRIPVEIAEKAERLGKAKDLEAAREEFKGLSTALISYLDKQNIKGAGYQENYCPMVNASWLQKEKKINNPYFGKSMSTCGENKRTF
jgi:Protein of unknown function (DUF3347)